MLTKRIKKLEPSPTFALAEKAKTLQAAGVSVIDLTLGEPDFITPENIRKAAVRSIGEGFTHYTATAGITKLREAISNKLLIENKIDYSPQEIVVGVGSKQLLYHAFQALCEQGDEVLLPVPTWSTYAEQIKLAEATPILVQLRPPFKLKVSDLSRKVSPRTKAILINTPSNPTGAVIEKEELEKIAELAVKKNLFIISDEIYEKIIFAGKHYSIASFGKEVKARTVTIGGFSKAYAMTGWRVGYAAGPKEVIEAMVSLQSQTTSNTSSIGQMAALEAINGPQKSIKLMLKEFSKRRNYICRRLSKIDGLTFTLTEGAFYFFICIEKLLGGNCPTSDIWCAQLLEKEGVAVVAGEAFLYPGYFRLSLTSSMANIAKAFNRIERFVKKI
jgi:aspartate aminotransferase